MATRGVYIEHRTCSIWTRTLRVKGVILATVQQVMQRVADEAPGSIRALGAAAGLRTNTQLVRALHGRGRLSPILKGQLVAVLRRWTTICSELADELERSV